MSRDIRAIWQIKKQSEFFSLIVVSVAIVGGLILNFIFGKMGMDEDFIGDVILGAMSFAYILMNFFIKVMLVAEEVPRGISFGMTRKKLFIYSRAIEFAELLILAIIAISCSSVLTINTTGKIIMIIFGMLMISEGLVGNNLLRYGKIVYWIYYVLFVIVIIGGPRLAESTPAVYDAGAVVIDVIITPFYNQFFVWGGVLLFTCVCVFINWLTLRRVPVAYNV